MQKSTNDIVIFLVIVSALILLLVAFIIVMLYLYKKRQANFIWNIEQIKLGFEKQLLAAQLEIQENTFQHISREIHDNISLSLTMAKLYLNTLDPADKEQSGIKISSSIGLLSKSINDLSNISRSLNADIIIQQGLIRAIENEIEQIRQAGNLNIRFELLGTPLYLDSKKELIIFRIIQEAFNNIIKHAKAQECILNLNYTDEFLQFNIIDNGIGFDINKTKLNETNSAGLKNMKARTKTLNGSMEIKSQPGSGTALSFCIPVK